MAGTRESELRAVTVGELKTLAGPVRIVDYNPEWPALFEAAAVRIRQALGNRALLVEHVGSTSVPGLPAKPVVDILTAVADSALEQHYARELESAGYLLRVREPSWYEHRLFQSTHPDVNLHVFTLGSAEIARMLAFRDWLRTNAGDRERYASTKKNLARQPWKYMQDYADAKSGVISDIMARAEKLNSRS